MMGEQFGKCDRCQQVMYAGHKCRAMTTDTPRTLADEVQRLVNTPCKCLPLPEPLCSRCEEVVGIVDDLERDLQECVELLEDFVRFASGATPPMTYGNALDKVRALLARLKERGT